MKLLEFKNYIAERLEILNINIVNSYRLDTAFIAQRWGSLASTGIYTVTFLLFINVLYTNVNTIAGYTRNEMLLFTLIGQIIFYTYYTWGFDNLRILIEDVNQGNLDLTLTKPLPHLFYISLKKISIITTLRDSLPTLLIIMLIDWDIIHITPLAFAAGVIIMICGQIALHTFQFIFAIPVFWLGQSHEIFGLAFEASDDHDIPYEGLNKYFKVIMITIIPTFMSSALATSVMLQKQNPYIMVFVSILVAISALLFKVWLWKLALRNYTSASS